jgi:hypothetical protein
MDTIENEIKKVTDAITGREITAEYAEMFRKWIMTIYHAGIASGHIEELLKAEAKNEPF